MTSRHQTSSINLSNRGWVSFHDLRFDSDTNSAINMTNTVVTNTVPFTRSFTTGRDGGIVNTGTVHVLTAGSEDWGDTNIAIARITDGYDKFKI